MEELTSDSDYHKLKKRQSILFYCALTAFSVLLLSWIASAFRNVFGFDPHWAGDNFAFNIMFLFPVTIVCLIVLFFTGALTVGYWSSFPNLTKKIVTVILSYAVFVFIGYVFFLILRQH